MPRATHPHHDSLPLEDLRGWVLPVVYEWLEAGDREAALLRAEMDAQGADLVADLFSHHRHSGGGGDDDGDACDDDQRSVDSDRSDADYEGCYGRVRVWSSSRTNVDGFGAVYKGAQEGGPGSEEDDGDGSIRIVYVISESWEGYGDMLWASSRHLGQLFAHPGSCRDLLAPLTEVRAGADGGGDGGPNRHPLHGLRVLELGAGCGVPSLTAMKCGARVVCTDLDNPNRVRCIAEAMERNWREMETDGSRDRNESKADPPPARFHRGRACPFRWGEPTEPVATALKDLISESSSSSFSSSTTSPSSETANSGDGLFDVICATDCLFMPWLHYKLLAGMTELLAPDGVIVIAFAIHEGYSKDDEVWPFVDKAKEKGFTVEVLDAVQLTPPKKGMPSKQGLVNMLRLTKNV